MNSDTEVNNKSLVLYNPQSVHANTTKDDVPEISGDEQNIHGILIFSPQSKHGSNNSSTIVKSNGNEDSSHATIAFSPQSKHGSNSIKQGKSSADEDSSRGKIAFSPQSKHGSDSTKKDKSSGDEVSSRGKIVFSPQSKHGSNNTKDEKSSGEEGSRHGKVAFSRQSKHRHQNAKKEKNIREGSGLGNVAYNAQSVHRNRATSPNGIETGEDVLWKSTNFARKGVGTKMAFILDRPRIDSNYPKNTAGTETLKTSKRRTSDQKSSGKEPGTSGDSSSLAPDASYHADSVHDIVEYFANDVTTLHALPNVFKSCTLLAKCMWSIIFLTGVFLFLFQTSLVIRKYRSGPIQVNLEVITKSELEFPKVTICNTNKLRRSAVSDSKYRQILIVDEQKSLPYYAPCIEDDFKCRNELICVKPFLICDGVNQCRDFSDEYGCTYGACNEGFFRCSNGSSYGACIADSKECDRVVDCYDGADENDCVCKGTEYKCVSRGGCIDKTKVCDGNNDCTDKSDEKDCEVDDNIDECGADAFQCWDVNECINRLFLCDGYQDCKDGSDEDPMEVCQVPTTLAPTPTMYPRVCIEGQFQCDGVTCIPAYWKCDGFTDCTDKTDEDNCNAAEEESSSQPYAGTVNDNSI